MSKNRMAMCPECRTKVKSENMGRHMENVHGRKWAGPPEDGGSGRGGLLMVIVIVAALIAAGAGVAWYTHRGGGGSVQPAQELPVDQPGTTDQSQGSSEVSIPVSSLSGDAGFYSTTAGGKTVRYFAVIGSDGEPRAAFDACDVCYDAHKGYRQDGSVMVCNNCGRQFSIDSLGTDNKAGGCWPSHLDFTVSDGKMVIKESDLARKAFMF